MTTFDLFCPPPPASWDPSQDYKLYKKVSAFVEHSIEPVGKEFMARIRRHQHQRTLADDLEMEQALMEANQETDAWEEDEPETPQLLKSDPSKWKVCIFSV